MTKGFTALHEKQPLITPFRTLSCSLWEQRWTVVHTVCKVCVCVCVGVTAQLPAILINKRIPLEDSPELSYHTAILSTHTAKILGSVHVR